MKGETFASRREAALKVVRASTATKPRRSLEEIQEQIRREDAATEQR